MILLELKKQLIDKIQASSDSVVLEEIYRILEMGTDDTEMYALNESQKYEIDAALKDIEDGNYISNEEANKEIDEWLKK